MNELQRVFSYKEKQVRTIVIDDEPWFVAKDVCDVLELGDIHKAVSRLEEDERNSIPVMDGLGRQQESWTVSEPGLYSLILGSRKPEAKEFKRWITHEVIPAIRKTGSYIVPATPTEALLQAVQILAVQEKQIKQLESSQAEHSQKLEALNHRVDNIDAVDVIGDMRQRLNMMVRKYARQKGLMFNVAWADFKKAFNVAYRTNLELLILNYKSKTGIKKVTIPQYLLAIGKLEDGIRIADKLINQAIAS